MQEKAANAADDDPASVARLGTRRRQVGPVGGARGGNTWRQRLGAAVGFFTFLFDLSGRVTP